MEKNPEAAGKQEKTDAYVMLAKHFEADAMESGESFPFCGMIEAEQRRIEESEGKTEAERTEYKEYATLLSDLLPRFKRMKIIGGNNRGGVNFHVAPADSEHPLDDTLPIESLEITPDMDPRLAKLIEMSRELKSQR